MTIKELKAKISDMPDGLEVVVRSWDEDESLAADARVELVSGQSTETKPALVITAGFDSL